MRVGWSTTAIFGDLAGHVFENFGDTASNTIVCFSAVAELLVLLFLLQIHHLEQPFCIHILQDLLLCQGLGVELTHQARSSKPYAFGDGREGWLSVALLHIMAM